MDVGVTSIRKCDIGSPLSLGDVHERRAALLDPVMLVTTGREGMPAGTMASEYSDHGPVPIELVARTWNVYSMPLVRPVKDMEVLSIDTVSVAGWFPDREGELAI
jgi:hypothetical protein